MLTYYCEITYLMERCPRDNLQNAVATQIRNRHAGRISTFIYTEVRFINKHTLQTLAKQTQIPSKRRNYPRGSKIKNKIELNPFLPEFHMGLNELYDVFSNHLNDIRDNASRHSTEPLKRLKIYNFGSTTFPHTWSDAKTIWQTSDSHNQGRR